MSVDPKNRPVPLACLSVAMPPRPTAPTAPTSPQTPSPAEAPPFPEPMNEPPLVVRIGDVERRIENDESIRFVIGRAAHCDLVLQGDDIDLEHLVITRENGAWMIRDEAVQGKAPLLRNGAQVDAWRVFPADDYRLGSHAIRFRID